jgi:hypothetical protein
MHSTDIKAEARRERRPEGTHRVALGDGENLLVNDAVCPAGYDTHPHFSTLGRGGRGGGARRDGRRALEPGGLLATLSVPLRVHGGGV